MRQLTKSAVLDALRAGDRVMVTHPDPLRATDDVRYSLVQRGRAIGKRTWAELQPDLVPINDGLFPEIGGGQTYALRDEG